MATVEPTCAFRWVTERYISNTETRFIIKWSCLGQLVRVLGSNRKGESPAKSSRFWWLEKSFGRLDIACTGRSEVDTDAGLDRGRDVIMSGTGVSSSSNALTGRAWTFRSSRFDRRSSTKLMGPS
ncbi:uncharacterized protein PV06_01001 [Exophiala oligosperma]|uniref:Uncharacterized protein n=1 Tax=Exophiala oligosperma TaxID=215243 RepID=A0A0D2EKI9_9EURO|nr:uncharacterized protein PV06_01001 [Exophiala oligosperma]KIW48414.1 hypothetical protein PV06_01001 [Exophiala oligosperma]